MTEVSPTQDEEQVDFSEKTGRYIDGLKVIHWTKNEVFH